MKTQLIQIIEEMVIESRDASDRAQQYAIQERDAITDSTKTLYGSMKREDWIRRDLLTKYVKKLQELLK